MFSKISQIKGFLFSPVCLCFECHFVGVCSESEYGSKLMSTKALMKRRHCKLISLNSLEMVVDFVPLRVV